VISGPVAPSRRLGSAVVIVSLLADRCPSV
jgi:hypothetical protein